jgi:DNA-binding NarL/FixJ family response regulator
MMKLLVGSWADYEKSVHRSAREIIKCEKDLDSIRVTLSEIHPSAVIVGHDVGDTLIRQVYMLMGPALNARLAILGTMRDVTRCERWMRQGCSAYLLTDSSVERVADVLQCVIEHDVCIVDRAFYVESLHARYSGPMPALTRRELEVLQLAAQGHRNSDIARILSVVDSTVEFHIRHTLDKLGARNRVEAVTRARSLGLLLLPIPGASPKRGRRAGR